MKKLLLFFAICSVLTTSAQNIPSYVPSNGLVAWYPFNGNANDESGNGNNGTVYGATLTTDREGNANSAYNFNVSASGGWGSAQQRIVVTNPSIPNNNQFTMSAWVNLDSKPSSFNNRPHSILGRWDGNGNSVFRFQLNDNTNYYSGQTFLQGDLPRIVSCPLVSFNNWHQHLISYDGNTLRRYLDGSMIDSFQINIQIPYSNSDLTFGEIHMANGHWLFFNGDMDDVGYWSRALSPSEIQALYNGNQPTASTNSRGCVECDSLNIGDEFVLNGDSMIVVNRPMLDSMITGGHDVTKACVSHVTDMRNLLRGQGWFNQDISAWDVSNVTNMNRMFKKASAFNQDISNWDVGNVNRMTGMFELASAFNQDLSDWCVRAFQYNAPPNFALNGALIPSHYPRWGNCPQDFDNITTLATGAFLDSNGCIDCSALNIGDYFELNGDTLLVVDRNMLDSLVLLHDDLSKVCVSHITDMKDALRGLSWFNTDISKWDVSNVTDMSNMFWKARTFNQDIGNWDVSKVTRMNRMFKIARDFNQDIGSWDVGQVERFQEMFRNADAFNQDIGYWNVSNVLNDVQMQSMFRNADNFSQNLSNWCVSSIASKPTGFDANSPLTASQLPLWGGCPPPASNLGTDTLSVCGQDSVLISARSGFDTYAWNTGETSSSIWVSQSGMYSVASTMSGQYTLDSSVYVSLVNASIAASDSIVCAGDSLMIVSIAHNQPPITQTGTLYGEVYETETLSLTAPSGATFTEVLFASYGTPTGSNGYYSTSSCHASNSVNIIKNLAIGNNSLIIGANNSVFGDPCGGTFKRLYVLLKYSSNSPQSNGISRLWSTGDTTASITANPPQTTTYYCTVSDGVTSCTDSLTVYVNNTLSLDLGADTLSVCGQDSALLDAGAGYSSYAWSNGDSTQSITVNSSGMYSCTVGGGTCTATDSVYVSIINASITASDSLVCAGDSVSLTAGNGASSILNSTSSSNLPSYLPTNGLVAWYPFNGNANDESGNGNNGNVYGATLTADRDGNVNSAYDFDYSNWSWGSGGDRIFIPYHSDFNSSHLSVSVWANRTSNGYQGQNHTIVNRFQYGYSNPNGQTWQVLAESAPNCLIKTQIIQGATNNNQANIVNTGPSLSINDWFHIVLTFDGISVKQYIDGILVDSLGANGITLNSVGNSGISLGVSNQANGSWGPFDGVIDDFGLWNRALTPSEIQSLYATQPSSNLTYNWSTGDTTASITANPTQNTTYYCTVSDGITSCTDSLTVYVNNTLSLELGADTLSVCGQDSVLLDAGAGYSSYAWSNGDSTQSITVNSSGMYSCTVGGGSCTATDSVYINIGLLDDPNNVTVDLSIADTASFNVNYLDSSTSYQWQLKTSFGWLNLLDSSSFYVGGKSHLLGLKNIGTNFNGFEFRCIVTSASCSEVSDSAVLTVIGTGTMVSNPVSLNEAVSQFIGDSNFTPIEFPVSIRPNPTTGIFYVHPFIEGTYSLIDSKGRTVERGRATPSYDLSSYPNGVYVLRLTLKTSTHQIRVIKQ